MPKKKDELVEETTATLDEVLLDKFAEELETTINKVCEDNPNADPRLELLVTLGLFSAQVSIDAGYNKKEFLSLMADMYDDSGSGSDIPVKKSDLN